MIDQSLPRDTMKKVNDSLAAMQGAFTASDEIAVFTYADGVNNPTDFTAALSARVPAVLQASKKEGDFLGAPVNSGPFPAVPASTVDRWTRISIRNGETPVWSSFPRKSIP